MRRALHAEWTKLRTVPAPKWLLLGAIAATVTLGAGATRLADGGDPTRFSLTGVTLGQAPVAVLSVQVISGEYGTGLIRTTFTAVPRRAAVLAAKAITLAAVVGATATVAVLGSLLAGHLLDDDRTALTTMPTLRAAAGSILYLTLIALLSLGVAAIVRDSATSTGTILALLYLLPLITEAIGNPHYRHLLERLSPTTTNLTATATWTTTTLLLATLHLQNRDP